ncbi:hypothetical protein AOLI_G00002580 [Acnodon oligacanthus]
MAESQLACMEDGQITQTIPETKPAFYYSEQQRAALETLLRDGDGAFKTRLAQDKAKDFLSAREIKVIRNTLVQFKTSEEEEEEEEEDEQRAQGRSADSSSMRSTYWPQMSDTEVPPLDIGWPNGGFFRGVTRVAVHTHPPKENGPHLKEVVRRLIQEASKVIAIVMDLLTDLQILQDLLDAASKRRVGSHHLQNIRTRVVKGVGFELSYGRIPGSLCSKYMIVDGDKVMFGSYSFSWTSSRMDRNMITVMSGQIVDFFDNDFRELYAITDKLDLFKEFHIGKPSTGTLGRVTVPKRPTLPATSRFQVSLGDTGNLKVPEHKYYNPKYLLAFGNIPGPSGSLPDLSGKKQTEESPEELASEKIPTQAGSDKLDTLKRLPTESTEKGTIKKFLSKYRSSQKSKGSKKDDSAAADEEGIPSPSTSGKPTMPSSLDDLTNFPEEPPVKNLPPVKEKDKKKKNSSQQTINNQETKGRKPSKNKCRQS